MMRRNWLRPAILGSALGLLPMLGCFGSSDDKGDNSGATGKPLPHDGTTRDDYSKPRDNAGTVTPKDPAFAPEVGGSSTPKTPPAAPK